MIPQEYYGAAGTGMATTLLATTAATATATATPKISSIILTTTTAAPHPTSTPLIPGYTPENWSSLIGIVTAIVGNVLISFALNIQRYAHIRIEREWKRRKEEQRKRAREELKRRRERGEEYRDGEDADGNGEDDEEHQSGERDIRKFHRPRHTEIIEEGDQHDARDGDIHVEATEDEPLLSASRRASFQRRGRGRRRTSNANGLSSSVSSSNTAASQEAYKQKSYLKSPWWWAGIILMTTGEAGNFLAYGFAPASIVSPLGVVALISNCIIAPIMLKEAFRKRDGLGVLVAVAGAVTVVASASSDNPKLGPDDIWGLITTWEFETYLAITVGVIIILMVASNRFGEKNILIDLGLVGLFGGYTALSTKGVASMLSYTLWHALTFTVTYLLVAILIFTAIMQIKYLNRALQRFDATQVIPVQFVLFTLSVILGSAILYRDFERTSGPQAGKFVGGCAMTFLGVWLITSGRHQRREGDEEEAIHLYDGERYRDEVDEGVENGTDHGGSRTSSTVRLSPSPLFAEERDKERAARAAAERPRFGSPPTLARRSKTDTTLLVPDTMLSNPWTEQADASAPSTTQHQHPAPVLRFCSSPAVSTTASVAVTTTPSSQEHPARDDHFPPAPPPANRPQTPTRIPSEQAAALLPPGPTTPGTERSQSLVQRLGIMSLGTAASASLGLGSPSASPGAAGAAGTAARRKSIHGLSSSHGHGPLLASPLSSTLSAVVADLKRGSGVGEGVRGGSFRGTALFQSHSVVEGEGRGEGDGHGHGHGHGRDAETREGGGGGGGVEAQRDGEQAPVTRTRSLSETLTDFWRGRRRSNTGASQHGAGRVREEADGDHAGPQERS